MSAGLTDTERPVALCCCGTPLVCTFEKPGVEWYCVGCEQWWDWLHARTGTAPNPTPELVERHKRAEKQYAAARLAREYVKGGE